MIILQLHKQNRLKPVQESLSQIVAKQGADVNEIQLLVKENKEDMNKIDVSHAK